LVNFALNRRGIRIDFRMARSNSDTASEFTGLDKGNGAPADLGFDQNTDAALRLREKAIADDDCQVPNQQRQRRGDFNGQEIHAFVSLC
jgi:hypothetical protein